jgi:hypothetical protein
MSYVTLPANLQAMFQDLQTRILKLETTPRFTVPIVATDPTNPRNGDMWINSTTNTLKVRDSVGATRTITWV